MKRKVWVGIIILVLGIILMGIVVFCNRTKIVPLSASWAYRYKDVQELTSNSDIIALIKVDKLSETIERKVPASIYQVTVLDGIKGCRADEKLYVYMTGGKVGRELFEVESDPLMKKGQQFLIFARENEDGTCTILGGPQGRFVYRNGRLNSLEGAFAENMPLNDMKAEISAFMD